MADINAAGYDDPTQVAKGGTGVASTTAYAVQCGGTTTTGATQSIAGVGTSGQVLTSNGAGALPTFQAAASGGADWTAISNSSASGSTVSFTSGLGTAYDEYLIVFEGLSISGTDSVTFAVSVDAGSSYTAVNFYGGASGDMDDISGSNPFNLVEVATSAGDTYDGFLIFGANKTDTPKYYIAGFSDNTGNDAGNGGGVIDTTADIDAIQFGTSGSNTFDAGNIYVLGR